MCIRILCVFLFCCCGYIEEGIQRGTRITLCISGSVSKNDLEEGGILKPAAGIELWLWNVQ